MAWIKNTDWSYTESASGHRKCLPANFRDTVKTYPQFKTPITHLVLI